MLGGCRETALTDERIPARRSHIRTGNVHASTRRGSGRSALLLLFLLLFLFRVRLRREAQGQQGSGCQATGAAPGQAGIESTRHVVESRIVHPRLPSWLRRARRVLDGVRQGRLDRGWLKVQPLASSMRSILGAANARGIREIRHFSGSGAAFQAKC